MCVCVVICVSTCTHVCMCVSKVSTGALGSLHSSGLPGQVTVGELHHSTRVLHLSSYDEDDSYKNHNVITCLETPNLSQVQLSTQDARILSGAVADNLFECLRLAGIWFCCRAGPGLHVQRTV